MAFYRRGEKNCLLVLGNFRKEEREIELPVDVKAVLLSNVDQSEIRGRRIRLEGYQALILAVSEPGKTGLS